MQSKGLKIGLTTVVLVAAFGGLLWSTLRDGTEYYKHVDEVMVQPQDVVRQEPAAARLRRRRLDPAPAGTRSTTASRSQSKGQVVAASYSRHRARHVQETMPKSC